MWTFADGFDLYTAATDPINGYWDISSPASTLAAFSNSNPGRFTGSRALAFSSASNTPQLLKTSGSNDAVHHIVCAFNQTQALSGTNNGVFFTLRDGATAQCTIVFRSDGAILLTSGVVNSGTTLATYTGAVTSANTWFAFEFEVIINNTTGSFTVRKNGNSTADFTATGLNTRGGTANNYANVLGVGQSSTSGLTDDLFWRSDASTVAWMGDLRCITRMPASDASVQFSRAPTSATQTPTTFNQFTTPTAILSIYAPITAVYDGTVSSLTLSLNNALTGNMKCSVFNGTAVGPTTVIASATTITNPVAGNNTFNFSAPFAVTKGTLYWVGWQPDATVTNLINGAAAGTGKTASTTYAAFPVASPSGVSTSAAPIFSWMIATSSNATVVSEAQQDATTSYVYDSTPGHADLYGIATIGSTPTQVLAVTTRGLMIKSDAGTRTAAVQIKSGATIVASPTLTLTTSGWQWAWRTDVLDPNTSAAWTAAAVDAVNIGPKTVA